MNAFFFLAKINRKYRTLDPPKNESNWVSRINIVLYCIYFRQTYSFEYFKTKREKYAGNYMVIYFEKIICI
jgi:hypothetical protein